MIDEFSVSELETRCETHLDIKVDDLKKATNLLRENLKDVTLKVLDGTSTIEIHNFTGKPSDINKLLAINDVLVESIQKSTVDLEDYFMKVIGGEE